MSGLFKDIYNTSFYDSFSQVLSQTITTFDPAQFKSLIFCAEFEHYELKARMNHTAKVLHHFLPKEFAPAVAVIKQIIDNLRRNDIYEDSIEFMFFPEYVAMYGLDDYENSVAAFEFITQYTSCEFAVRPFIVKYQAKMLQQMLLWSSHHDRRVRRLASEGARPRLPWAMALPSLKQDPTPLLAIFDQLKQDPYESVRRSVANNLNDIAKDNPDVVIGLAKSWLGHDKETDWLVKHGCRTLLKQGNSEILTLFGFDSRYVGLSNFEIKTPEVKIGSHLEFSFSLTNTANKNQMVRLEYGLYYQKKNGELSRKVFKISERELAANQNYDFERKQSFKLITTRVFHPGLHQLALIINGKEQHLKSFQLLK
ncbi:MAG: DNA alkylation repair protein [Gammaproteobacteria bacterium]|nr:DNA alkylation repair protein [Gammaproteobacteria bacterium]